MTDNLQVVEEVRARKKYRTIPQDIKYQINPLFEGTAWFEDASEVDKTCRPGEGYAINTNNRKLNERLPYGNVYPDFSKAKDDLRRIAAEIAKEEGLKYNPNRDFFVLARAAT